MAVIKTNPVNPNYGKKLLLSDKEATFLLWITDTVLWVDEIGSGGCIVFREYNFN